MTGVVGADVVFEASGSASAAVQAFEMVRKQGQIIFISIAHKPIELNLRKLQGKALTVRGSSASKWIDYELTRDLILSGQVRVEPIITHRFPITEWRRAFDAVTVEKKAGKVILNPI